jgi:hypothetical protein
MSLKNMAAKLHCPKEFVKRKLNESGLYDVGDGWGLNERRFYDIRGVGEITTIDEFKQRAFAIVDDLGMELTQSFYRNFTEDRLFAAADPREGDCPRKEICTPPASSGTLRRCWRACKHWHHHVSAFCLRR